MKRNSSTAPFMRNIGYLSALVFVLSLQVLIVLVFIYQFIPLKMAPITAGVPEKLLKLFHPNRNHFFYHAFIAAAISGQALALYIFRKRLNLPELAAQIRVFLIVESVWVSWQLLAVFKILQYDNPGWARILLYAGFVAALLGKIFWPELKRGLKSFQIYLGNDFPASWRPLADGGISFILLVTIAIPDIQKALIRLTLVDSNNHFDQWLMAPLWAYHKGLIPALQSFNPLNWGVIVLTNALVGVLGGVTYAHVLVVLCLLAIIYYMAFYFLLRRWLGILPAAFGVLLAVKLQMFNTGISPFIWIYPGESIVRHLGDVAVFFCLFLFAQGQGEIFMWIAGWAVGISMGLIFDTGMYLLLALYAYVAVLLFLKDTRSLLCPSPRQWRKVLGLVFLPWFSMVMVLVLCFGAALLHKEFWMESFKDIPRWLEGGDAISIFSCLKDRNFFAFFASFFPPLMYAAGMAVTMGMVSFRIWKSEKLFLIPLSVYGFGVYAHFLWHGSINYYYLVPLPLVGCLVFWGTECLKGLIKSQQRLVKIILGLAAGIALFTNVFFTYYPNVLNLSGENWDQEKAYYKANFTFDSDTDFIRHWTLPHQRVALISGFETQILLQADRAPFFYKSLTLMDQGDLQRLVDQLGEDRPRQVFINKSILNEGDNASLRVLTEYLKAHYQYTDNQSNNLVLLQSKESPP